MFKKSRLSLVFRKLFYILNSVQIFPCSWYHLCILAGMCADIGCAWQETIPTLASWCCTIWGKSEAIWCVNFPLVLLADICHLCSILCCYFPFHWSSEVSIELMEWLLVCIIVVLDYMLHEFQDWIYIIFLFF